MALFLAVGIFAAACLPLLFGLTFFGTDHTRIAIPRLHELKQFFSAHQWPWLSSWIGPGEPFFANLESQVLYPVRWIEMLFPAEWGAHVGVAIHLSLAAVGVSRLARTF